MEGVVVPLDALLLIWSESMLSLEVSAALIALVAVIAQVLKLSCYSDAANPHGRS